MEEGRKVHGWELAVLGASPIYSSMLAGIHKCKKDEKLLNWAQKAATEGPDPANSGAAWPSGAGAGAAWCWAGWLEGSAPGELLSPSVTCCSDANPVLKARAPRCTR